MAGEQENQIRPDSRPLGAFRFSVSIQGFDGAVARFQSVNGINHEFEITSHQEGGLNDRTHKLPGQGSYPNLVLKTGYVLNPALEQWHLEFSKKRGPRRTVTVNLLNLAGETMRTWSFSRCWPVKWEGPQLDGSQAQIAVQTLELAYDEISS